MKLSDFNLAELLEFKPDEGRLILANERMLIFRQEAFAFLRSLLLERPLKASTPALTCALSRSFGRLAPRL